MYEKIKSEILDIIDIVNKCPESLQERCFEVLLNCCISSTTVTKQTCNDFNEIDRNDNKQNIENSTNEQDNNNVSNDISINDFHIKIRKFLNTNEIDISLINNLFYKEDNKIKPLYDSLNSTKMSESQIRIALLIAFENSFIDNDGEMYFYGEEVRERCKIMKCYDGPNFVAIFKNNSELFDNWDGKYNKDTKYVISTSGKKKLADTLKNLQEGN